MEMDPARQKLTDTETAGVIARPPLLFLVAFLIGSVLDHLLPFPVARTGSFHRISAIIAGALILTGIAVFAAGIRNFSARRHLFKGPSPPERW